MNRSKWIKPLLQITVAATLISLLSVSVSILFIPNISSMDTALIRQYPPVPLSGSQSDKADMPIVLPLIPVANSPTVNKVKTVMEATIPLKSDAESSIQQAVNEAISSLAEHPSFASWEGASTEIQPLGPGTHGWVIHISSPAKEPLGYMIIHATEHGGYSLTEYGTGQQYPFNRQILSQATEALDWPKEVLLRAEPYYIKPLLSVWKIDYQGQTEWLDATSGEVLHALEEHIAEPQTINNINRLVRQSCDVQANNTNPGINLSSSSPSYTIDSPALVRSNLDPYDDISWMAAPARMTGEHASQELRTWDPKENGKPYIYIVRISGDKNGSGDMNFPYTLLGKQAWTLTSAETSSINQPDACQHTTKTTAYYAVKAPGAAGLRYIAEPLLITSGSLVKTGHSTSIH